jgi:beta-N-acetylglucosaminidase
MLVLQFKQLSDIDKSFAKSIINGFQYTTEDKEHIFVVSQSATILSVPRSIHSHPQAEGISSPGNEEVLVSSANYLFKYLSQQVGMSYQEIRQKRVELGQIMERCRFFLVRKSKHQEG